MLDDLQAQIDVLALKACGDSEIDTIFGEVCDSENLDGLECSDFGSPFGELMCSEDCTFDTTDCSDEPLAFCGNGIRENPEQCDGPDLGAGSCESEGFPPGELTCLSDCTFNTIACGL